MIEAHLENKLFPPLYLAPGTLPGLQCAPGDTWGYLGLLLGTLSRKSDHAAVSGATRGYLGLSIATSGNLSLLDRNSDHGAI